MKKIIGMILIPLLLLTATAGCAATEAGPVDLSGSWVSTGSEAGFEAEISDGEITVNAVGEDFRALYWQGTFPTEQVTGETVITSEGDIEALSHALMGSGAETKEFTYSDGDLSFEFSIMGTTRTIHMERKP